MASPTNTQLLARADEAVTEARELLARRRSSEAVSRAYAAGYWAAEALRTAVGLDLNDPGPSGGLVHFLTQLGRVKKRLESGLMRQIHVEEAAVWVRKTGEFVVQARGLVERLG